MSALLPIWSLTQREVVRFLRQRSRVTGAFAQPIIFWVLFGVGLSGSFQMPESAVEQGARIPAGYECPNCGVTIAETTDADASGLSYQAYFIPGVAAMIVLFTAIFSSISVIQDRNEGFMQGVLAAPVPRSSLVLGKIMGGTLLAFVQALLFIGLALLLKATGLVTLEFSLGIGQFLVACLLILLMGLGLCGLGFFFAWRLDSVQGFHAIMSVLLFPMWLMSGAFFPSEGSGWLKWIIAINPMTYGVAGLRRIMFPESSAALPSLAICFAVTALFAVVMVTIDTILARRPQT